MKGEKGISSVVYEVPRENKIMLYLFGTGAYESDRKALKVGYTDSKKDEQRRKGYKLHNPLGKFLAEREGDRVLEMKLHLRLTDWKTDFLDEWFYNEPEVIEIFGQPENKIDQWLWEHRSQVLLSPDFPRPGTIRRKILDELQEIYGGNSDLGQKNL